MNRDQASSILVDLISHGVRRGAYSNVEVNAINEALSALQTPINTEQNESKQIQSSNEGKEG